jgi:hypothetical protein
MTRYILIERNSGFVWGDIEADDPVSACRAVDAENKADECIYIEHGAESIDARSGKDGYFVYKAPADFPVMYDGQAKKEIAAVKALPCVAFVECAEPDDA